MTATARAAALALDSADPLASFRDQFVFEDELVYLDGDSLGRLPKATLPARHRRRRAWWAGHLIRSWGEG